MHSLIQLVAGMMLAVLAACGPSGKPSSSDNGGADSAASPNAGPNSAGTEQEGAVPQQDSTLILGKKIYESYCLACHQADGSGVPGMYPPLTDTAWLANEEKLINVILEGLSGTITVHGETYNQMMPTHNFLDDDEVAAVLNYTKKQFGKEKGNISPEQVKAQRSN